MKIPASFSGFALLTCLVHTGHAQQYTLKRSSSPLANYHPENITEVQTGTTSSTYKTYADGENKGARTSVDLSRGFLYLNPGTGKLEAVQNEGGTDRDSQNYTNDNGLPASQVGNFREQQAAGTNSRYKVDGTNDTNQSGVALDSQTSFMRKNPVTGEWEAVLREPRPNNADGSGNTTYNSNNQPSLGDRVANGVTNQMNQSMSALQRQQAQNNAALAAQKARNDARVPAIVSVPISNRPANTPTTTKTIPATPAPIYSAPTPTYGHGSGPYGHQ